jgi:predicted ArsR family transcriptional regulator
MIEAREEHRPRGRPAKRWHLTEAASAHFPESYGDLALDLLAGARDAFGEVGVEQLIAARTDRQLAQYRSEMPTTKEPLAKRVAALSKLRSREGYMAQWKRQKGEILLIENNCPICTIAQQCQGICGAELELFKSLLGPKVHIERTEHMIAGDRRCTYQIRDRG